MADHIIGLRKARGVGWETGVVHARVRHGAPALELRAVRYSLTLQTALESLGTPERLNGHAGCAGDVLGATAGLAARELILRDFLAYPGATLLGLHHGGGHVMTRRKWAERAGVSARQLRRILKGEARPSLDTARKLLEALQ